MLKPQAGATRDLVNLDGVWRFALDEGGEPWVGPLTGSLEAAVPASYNDLFVDPAIRNHVGVVWYQRSVQVPRGWAGERIVLRVDAATHAGAGLRERHARRRPTSAATRRSRRISRISSSLARRSGSRSASTTG